jgi:hypothetical protein
MKYCKKCKRLHNDEEQACKNCKKSALEATDNNTPVYLHSASGFELQRIKTALEDNQIPCSTVTQEKNFSAEAVTGYDVAEYDLLVPFSAYEKAYDICVGIGVFKNDEAEISEEDAMSGELEADALKFENMSVGRRIISALCLIILITGVVFGTDTIIRFIQELIG